MIILGIDPGLAITGFGVIQTQGSKLQFVTCGVIRTQAQLELPERLFIVSRELKTIIEQYQPETMACESLFFCNNAKTAFLVGQARGIVLLTAYEHQLSVSSYTPLQIKNAVCGYGQATKKQVQYMVQKLLNLSHVPKPDDAADALAIAICHSHSQKINSLSRRK